MSMKSKFGALGMLAAMVAISGNTPYDYSEPIKRKETEEERKKRLSEAEIKTKKANGLKEFFFDLNSLFALNQKSADKKARKLNWIK